MELLDDPTLLGKPFGVRASKFLLIISWLRYNIQVGFGVLTTASYEARKYGVRSGMPSKPILWYLSQG